MKSFDKHRHEAGARFHEKKTGPFLTLPSPSRGKNRG